MVDPNSMALRKGMFSRTNCSYNSDRSKTTRERLLGFLILISRTMYHHPRMLPPTLQQRLFFSISNLNSSHESRRVSLSLLADRCSSMDQAKQVHAQMIITARIHDHFAASRLISFGALSGSGDLTYAMRIFENTHCPNNFMWNTLIRAQASGSNPRRALALYVEMRNLGVLPNSHSYPFVLKACGILKSLEYCKQIHTHISKLGFSSDPHVVNGLVRAYSVSSDLESAHKVFDEIPERDLSIWTTMVCGYAQNFRWNDALVLFDRMVLEGFEPNGATLASVLSACAHSGSLELGRKIHNFMEEREIEVGVILGTALVHMYAKNGEISIAKNLFDNMKARNIATWNAMICGLAAHGAAQEALNLFLILEKENVLPNDVTFVGVLSACCHAGFVETGRKMFDSMKTVYRIKPRIEHYGCMVDLLGRNGQLQEALELVKEMPFKADAVILGSLMSASKSYENVDVAERVAKEMLSIDPNNHGAYVVLSNIYGEYGRWKDIERVRKMMKRKNLVKDPGWSLVDGTDPV